MVEKTIIEKAERVSCFGCNVCLLHLSRSLAVIVASINHQIYYISYFFYSLYSVIPLDGCTVRLNDQKTKGGPCFELAHETRRTFYLYAADNVERDNWTQAILTVINLCRYVFASRAYS